MSQLKLYLPENFGIANIEQLLKDNPTDLPGVNTHYIAYFCHLLNDMKLRGTYDPEDNTNGWIPLQATLLHRIIPHYNNVIKYLCELDIIEVDRNYIVKQYSRHYRFSNYFRRQLLAPQYIKDYKLLNKLSALGSQFSESQKLWTRCRNYLYKPFRDKLIEIDYEAALHWLEEEYEIGNTQNVIKIETFNNQKRLIKIIRDNEYQNHLFVDDKGNRFYSPITGIKKELRRYLTYLGEPLVSYDIKNSQPFFSQILFQQDFYRDKKTKKGQIRLSELDKEIYKHIIPTIQTQHLIMIPEYWQTQAEQGFGIVRYLEQIRNGKLYEYLYNKIKSANKRFTYVFEEAKDKIKRQVMLLLYNHIQGNRVNINLCKEIFVQEFPDVYQVFQAYKTFQTGSYKKYNINKGFQNVDIGFAKLPILLQKVESHILLDVVCKRLYLYIP